MSIPLKIIKNQNHSNKIPIEDGLNHHNLKKNLKIIHYILVFKINQYINHKD